MFRAAGINPDPYRDPDSRLRAPAIRKLWEQCVKLTNNPCFGFEVGMATHPGNLHAVGYAWLASRNVREALQRLVRYHRLLSTAMEASIEETEDELALVIEPSKGWPQEGVDAITAGIVAMCREISYEEFRPLRVDMTRAGAAMRETTREVLRVSGALRRRAHVHRVSSRSDREIPAQAESGARTC